MGDQPAAEAPASNAAATTPARTRRKKPPIEWVIHETRRNKTLAGGELRDQPPEVQLQGKRCDYWERDCIMYCKRCLCFFPFGTPQERQTMRRHTMTCKVAMKTATAPPAPERKKLRGDDADSNDAATQPHTPAMRPAPVDADSDGEEAREHAKYFLNRLGHR